jgi:Carboxypeptidase regulatory-like domain
MNLRTFRAHARVSLSLAAAVLSFALASCGGKGGSLGTGDATRQAQPPSVGLPPIPLDLAPGRSAGAQTSTVIDGIDEYESSSGTSDIGTKLRLPSTTGGLAYAMYRHQVGSDSLISVLTTMDVIFSDQAWVGIANYGTFRWDFIGPFPAGGTAQFSSLGVGDYTSAAGNAYVVVVTYGGTISMIETVEFVTDDTPPVTYSVSGLVTDSNGGAPMQGVQITVNPGNHTANTGVDGSYTVGGLVAGNYTAQAAYSSYLFSPAPANFTVGPDATGVDFSGSLDLNTYSISGHVSNSVGGAPLSGVLITLLPGGATAYTDVGGDYGFSGLSAGPYSLSAELAGYTFAPGNRDVSLGPDAAGVDFSGTLIPLTYAISGIITNSAGGAPMAGVLVTINPGNYQDSTDGSGQYGVGNLSAGSYTVTPSFTNFTFNPASTNVSVGPDLAGVDFEGTEDAAVVTYTNDAKPIFDGNCIGCHSGNFPSGGLKLDNYNDCKDNITQILNRLDADTMPPGGGLPQMDKDTLHAWNDGGLLP